MTWILFNKHCYEEFVYMDKKIHQSLSKMIDSLHLTNDETDLNEFSPADLTQLLNRFLAFDEEMSEVACLYKVTQQKYRMNRSNHPLIDESSSMCHNALALPSNGSSIESGLDETREISSMSSVDEYLLEHQISSTNLLEEQPKGETNEPPVQIQINDENQSKTSQLNHRNETSTLISDHLLTFSKGILSSDLFRPRKSPFTTNSKIQTDLGSLAMPLLRKSETTANPLPSFNPETFPKVTPADDQTKSKTTTTTATSSGRLNFNLRSAIPLNSPINARNLQEILSQTNTNGLDFSSLISKNSKKSEIFSDSHWSECDEVSSTNPRLQIRLSKQTNVETTTTTKKKIVKGKPIDENIDELVKFIDGDETTKPITESKSKKTKKKKSKQNRTIVTAEEPIVEPTKDNVQTCRSSTPSVRSTTDSPCRSSSPSEGEQEEEKEQQQINWVTISRKPTKQKSTPTAPIVSTQTNKTKQKTKNNSHPSQKPNPNPKSSIHPKTNVNSTIKTVTKPTAQTQQTKISIPKAQQPTTSCWKKILTTPSNSIPQGNNSLLFFRWITPLFVSPSLVDLVESKSTLTATAAAFVPSATRIDSNPSTDSSFVPYSTDSSSRNDWDFTSYLLPSTFLSQSALIPPPPPRLGPVQRPTGSFSSVPSNCCIQRPSSEPRSSPFPFYSSSIHNDDNSQSIWTNNSSSNSNESLWPSSQEPPMRTSPTFDDFPLYDPFKSGTGLAIPLSSSLPPGFEGFHLLIQHFHNYLFLT